MLSTEIKAALIGAGVVALVSAAIVGYREIEHKGALKVLTHQADSTEAVRDTAFKSKEATFLQHVRSDSAAARATAAREARDRALHAKLDSATHALSAAVDSAKAALADSLATNERLRVNLTRVIAKSDSAEKAHNAVELSYVADTLDLHKQLRARDVTVAAGVEALNSAKELIASTIKQRDLYKEQVPSFLGRWGPWGVTAAAVIVAVVKK
jgi:hypothetical protein